MIPTPEAGRILIVAPEPPPYGGMSLQAQLLYRLLQKDGREVSFFAANFPLPPLFRFASDIAGLRTLVRFIATWPKLWNAARSADIVHIFAASWLYFFALVYPAVVLGRMAGARVVMNYRGGDAARFFAYWGWAAAPAFHLADAVTVPSSFLVKVIGTRFRVPVSIVRNVVDASRFQFRYRTAIRPRFLTTRYLEKMYDVESVLRAFRLVQRQHCEASLWIAGTGSEERRLRGLVAEWNLQNVRFLGNVARDELPDVCDQCDVLLNASLIDNFPGSLVEGSAAGLVVISTASGGIPAMYENGRTALLVQPGDWQGIAQCIELVLARPLLAGKLTEQARALVAACSWPEVCKSLYVTYGFVAERERRAPVEG